MAPSSEPSRDMSEKFKEETLLFQLILLHKSIINEGYNLSDLKKCDNYKKRVIAQRKFWSCNSLCFFAVLVIFISVILNVSYIETFIKNILGMKCFVPNNYIVWEATRPVADCNNLCVGVKSILELPNITRSEFKKYAYSSKPMVIKGAALNWPAKKTFNYEYFKNLYESTEGAYESIDEECQFLNFKTELRSLKDVFSMSLDRVQHLPGEKPWYIGWSNCHTKILEEMRRNYQKPHFLPAEAEHSYVDYIFMGYQEGAYMHLDYISRLMWQAQLLGHKVWRLNPPPECERVCEPMTFTVHPGDILLVDTRQWYHDTHVPNGEFSLSVSSEYG